MRTGSRFLALAVGLGAAAAAVAIRFEAVGGAMAAEGTQEAPKDIIADQLRAQGYTCDKPLSAERDVERSKPNEAVWVLKCDHATYRVRLIPNMAAGVERLE